MFQLWSLSIDSRSSLNTVLGSIAEGFFRIDYIAVRSDKPAVIALLGSQGEKPTRLRAQFQVVQLVRQHPGITTPGDKRYNAAIDLLTQKNTRYILHERVSTAVHRNCTSNPHQLDHDRMQSYGSSAIVSEAHLGTLA